MTILSPLVRRSGILALAVVGLAALGCGDKSGVGKTEPVSGKVTLDDKPLTTGSVTYHPDEAKGNKSEFSPNGSIGEDGTYTLSTSTRTGLATGAPPGWYKVTVSTMVPMGGMGGQPMPQPGGKPPPLPKPIPINPKYTDPAHTDLSVEVVESPAAGAYDLKLTK
jgi:hypothetical protein